MCVVNNFHMCCYAFHVYCYDFHELLCFACVLLCFPRVLLCFPCVVMLSICVMLSMFFRQIFWPFSPNHVAFPEKLMEWKSPHPLPNHRIPPFYQTSQSHPSAVLAPWNCWHLSAVSLLSFLSKQLIFFKFLLMGGFWPLLTFELRRSWSRPLIATRPTPYIAWQRAWTARGRSFAAAPATVACRSGTPRTDCCWRCSRDIPRRSTRCRYERFVRF